MRLLAALALAFPAVCSAREPAPVRVYDMASPGSAPAIPFAASARADDVLLALADGGTMTIERRGHVQRIRLDGKPRSASVDWNAIAASEWSPDEDVSPDGSWVAIRTSKGRRTDDDSRGPVRVELDGGSMVDRAWSPDGRSFAYEFHADAGGHQLRVYDVPTGTTRVLFSWRIGSILTLRWSPDSNLLGLTLVTS